MPARKPERRPGRALLVAEAPSPGRNRRALDGAAGDRLARMAGLDRAQLLDQFDAWNLVGLHHGREGKGSRWPLDLARRNAARHPLRGVVVLLGGRVARAYGLQARPLWEWLVVGERQSGHDLLVPVAQIARIPHPSGVCRTYNEAEARERAARVLEEARWTARVIAEGALA